MGNITREKAIELLEAILQTGEYEGDPDDSDAIKLGLSALESLVYYQNTSMPAQCLVLKGEEDKELSG